MLNIIFYCIDSYFSLCVFLTSQPKCCNFAALFSGQTSDVSNQPLVAIDWKLTTDVWPLPPPSLARACSSCLLWLEPLALYEGCESIVEKQLCSPIYCVLQGLQIVYFLPFTFYLLPFTFYFLLFTFYFLPFTFYLLLFTFYLLPFTFYFLPFT